MVIFYLQHKHFEKFDHFTPTDYYVTIFQKKFFSPNVNPTCIA